MRPEMFPRTCGDEPARKLLSCALLRCSRTCGDGTCNNSAILPTWGYVPRTCGEPSEVFGRPFSRNVPRTCGDEPIDISIHKWRMFPARAGDEPGLEVVDARCKLCSPHVRG